MTKFSPSVGHPRIRELKEKLSGLVEGIARHGTKEPGGDERADDAMFELFGQKSEFALAIKNIVMRKNKISDKEFEVMAQGSRAWHELISSGLPNGSRISNRRMVRQLDGLIIERLQSALRDEVPVLPLTMTGQAVSMRPTSMPIGIFPPRRRELAQRVSGHHQGNAQVQSHRPRNTEIHQSRLVK